MGWTSYNAKNYKNGRVDRKAELDLLLTYHSEKFNDTVLKSSMVGNVYYAAIERFKKETGERYVWAAIFKTSTNMSVYDNFSYKGMDETCEPYLYDCPKGILDLLTPTDNDSANKWRRLCRENREKKKSSWLKNLPIGSKVKFTTATGDEVILTKHEPAYQFKTWFWFDEANYRYIKKNRVNEDNAVLIQ